MKNDNTASAPVTMMFAVAVPPIGVWWTPNRCRMSATGIIPKRFWKSTKKKSVIRYGRYRFVSLAPSTGASISSRRYTTIVSMIWPRRPLVM